MPAPDDLGFDATLWRALDVVRIAATGYAALAYVVRPEPYVRPWLGWLVLAAMLGWSLWFATRARRSTALVVADLVVAVLAVLSTLVVDTPEAASATNTLPLIWPVAAVMAWALWRGPVYGITAAATVGVADLLVLDEVTRRVLHNVVLMCFAGGVVGFAATVHRQTRRTLTQALQSAAAARERERLARDIHDSVLQVLALIQRRGAEIGGEASDLGRLAGEQEARLRALVSTAAPTPGATGIDLVAALRPLAGARVQVSGPAEPVLLQDVTAQALIDATRACLHNVEQHAGEGAQAFVLVEETSDTVVVAIRDDGVGFEPGRPEQARVQGRLGLASSVRGRIEEMGGQVEVWSAPGHGVDIELRVPRHARTGAR